MIVQLSTIPVFSLELLVEAAGDYAARQAADRIYEDDRGEQRASSGGFEGSHNHRDKQEEDCEEDLRAGADQCGEQVGQRRAAKHIAVNHLPSRLLSEHNNRKT